MESDRAKVDVAQTMDAEVAAEKPQQARQPKRRFVGRKEAAELAERHGKASQTIEDSGALQGMAEDSSQCQVLTHGQSLNPEGWPEL